MAGLRETHPDIAQEFQSGKFTIQKTRNTFSAIAIDQAHEQNNGAVKGDGGAIGLTQNPDLLRRWAVAGPELARLICEFEASMVSNEQENKHNHHHEQTKSIQSTFTRQVQSLVEVMDVMGNPFSDDTKELYRLDTKEIAEKCVVKAINDIEKIGQDQYDEYVTERFLGKKPISHPIKKNKLPLFRNPPIRQQSKTKQRFASLKNDCTLFSRLYIACQTRDGDLKEFFKHENQSYPPSLSVHGSLRLGKKSDLLGCLEDLAETSGVEAETDTIILDGAAIVNMVTPGTAKTFDDYALTVFVPYIQGQLQRANRVDIVWDTYTQDSLKAHTRKQRGEGTRRKVQGSVVMPTKWQQFLRVNESKTKLFAFLAHHIAKIETKKLLVTTLGSGILSNHPQDTSNLAAMKRQTAICGRCSKIMVREALPSAQ